MVRIACRMVETTAACLHWPCHGAAQTSARAARPRRGSLERPINARMYRGTWLLVALPLLLAAFTVARPQPLPPPALPPAFDAAPRAARARARAALPRPLAGLGRRDRSGVVAARPADALRLRAAPGRTASRRRSRAAAGQADEPGRGDRRVAAPDRGHGPPGQQRRGPRRERQRLGHGSADRARSRLRAGVGDDAVGDAGPRTRSSSSRPTAARSARSAPRASRQTRHSASDPSPSSTSTRSAASARRGSRSRATGALARRRARPDRGGPRPRAVRHEPLRARRAAAAARPRLPVHARRAGPVRRPRHPGDDADDRPRRSLAGFARHPAERRRGWASSAARRRLSSARSTPASS